MKRLGKLLYWVALGGSAVFSAHAQEWGDCVPLLNRLQSQFYVDQRIATSKYQAGSSDSYLLNRFQPNRYSVKILGHFEQTKTIDGQRYRIQVDPSKANASWVRLSNGTLGMYFSAPATLQHENQSQKQAARMSWVLSWSLVREIQFEEGWNINPYAYYPFGMYSTQDEFFLQWLVSLRDILLEMPKE